MKRKQYGLPLLSVMELLTRTLWELRGPEVIDGERARENIKRAIKIIEDTLGEKSAP